MGPRAGGCAPPASRPALEVADIARGHGAALARERALGPEQRKVLGALVRCRTAALGGHLDVCDSCDYERPSYNSCRNRHCPKCQALAQHRWLEARRARILPVHHFHVVFTLPPALRPVVQQNRRLLYTLLFRSGPAALLELAADSKHLGAQLGLTAVLHTWSRDLSFHPHLHCVVTGGGLDERGQWKGTRPGFLLPVRVLGRLFRGKWVAALRQLYDGGQLELRGRCADLADPDAFGRWLDRLAERDWVVYCKPPFGGADEVYAYLGRYTHRVGISNHRLLSLTDRAVTFRTRHGKTASLPPEQFLSRFVSHVLPPGFVRIRHYGLLASGNVHTRLEQARAALEAERYPAPRTEPDPDDDPEPGNEPEYVRLMRALTGVDLRRCPRCRCAALQRQPLSSARSRDPP